MSRWRDTEFERMRDRVVEELARTPTHSNE
jgi:hypothetical protein